MELIETGRGRFHARRRADQQPQWRFEHPPASSNALEAASGLLVNDRG